MCVYVCVWEMENAEKGKREKTMYSDVQLMALWGFIGQSQRSYVACVERWMICDIQSVHSQRTLYCSEFSSCHYAKLIYSSDCVMRDH